MTQLPEPFDAQAWANRPEPKAAYVVDDNPRPAFVDEMRSYGFDQIPAMPAIGKIERCKSPADKGTKKSGWYIYNEIADDYKTGAYIGIGVFGSWNGDPERVVWTSKRRESMSPAESARFEEQLRAEKIARDEELKAVRAAAPISGLMESWLLLGMDTLAKQTSTNMAILQRSPFLESMESQFCMRKDMHA